MRQRAGNIIKNILLVLAVALLVIQVGAAAKGSTPSVLGYRVLRVISSSMQPAIPDQTCILIRSVPADSLEEGDVITYISTDPSIYGCYNTHRIYDKYTDNEGGLHFITKGDANEEPDVYEVLPERIVGKYLGEIPFGRYIGKGLNYLTDRRVYFLVIILPLLICMMSYIVQIVRTLMEDKEDEEE